MDRQVNNCSSLCHSKNAECVLSCGQVHRLRLDYAEWDEAEKIGDRASMFKCMVEELPVSSGSSSGSRSENGGCSIMPDASGGTVIIITDLAERAVKHLQPEWLPKFVAEVSCKRSRQATLHSSLHPCLRCSMCCLLTVNANWQLG
jgi:hypothetical protein